MKNTKKNHNFFIVSPNTPGLSMYSLQIDHNYSINVISRLVAVKQLLAEGQHQIHEEEPNAQKVKKKYFTFENNFL